MYTVQCQTVLSSTYFQWNSLSVPPFKILVIFPKSFINMLQPYWNNMYAPVVSVDNNIHILSGRACEWNLSIFGGGGGFSVNELYIYSLNRGAVEYRNHIWAYILSVPFGIICLILIRIIVTNELHNPTCQFMAQIQHKLYWFSIYGAALPIIAISIINQRSILGTLGYCL